MGITRESLSEDISDHISGWDISEIDKMFLNDVSDIVNHVCTFGLLVKSRIQCHWQLYGAEVIRMYRHWSGYLVVGSAGLQSLWRRPSHMASLAASGLAMYSASSSVVERATTVCFLDFHDIAPPLSIKEKHIHRLTSGLQYLQYLQYLQPNQSR
jgi:hypothetical protein